MRTWLTEPGHFCKASDQMDLHSQIAALLGRNLRQAMQSEA